MSLCALPFALHVGGWPSGLAGSCPSVNIGFVNIGFVSIRFLRRGLCAQTLCSQTLCSQTPCPCQTNPCPCPANPCPCEANHCPCQANRCPSQANPCSCQANPRLCQGKILWVLGGTGPRFTLFGAVWACLGLSGLFGAVFRGFGARLAQIGSPRGPPHPPFGCLALFFEVWRCLPRVWGQISPDWQCGQIVRFDSARLAKTGSMD